MATKKPQTIDLGIGKMPPQAIDFEEAVLGAILLEKDAFLIASEIISESDFYKESNALVFEAAKYLYSKGEPIDMLTVTQRLRQNGKIDEVGGAYCISELTTRVASAAHIDYHARIVKDKSLLRKFIAFSTELQRLSYDEDVDKAIDYSRNDLFKIFEQINRKGAISWKEVISQGMTKIKQNMAIKQAGKSTGIPTGFSDLDKYTSGWQDSDSIIIAAKSSMGKTSMALKFIKEALMNGYPCKCYSLEMAASQLFFKMAGSNGVNPRLMMTGGLTTENLAELDDTISAMEDWKFFINDNANISISEIEIETERDVIKNGIKLIVIDYLQLIKSDIEDEYARITNISMRLKQLAKRCNIPIIALSQLKRTQTEGKPPSMNDLRGSGSIEQDADVVIFVHRESYYDKGNKDLEGIGDLIIAKNRMGGTGTIKFKHNNIFTEFTDFNENPF